DALWTADSLYEAADKQATDRLEELKRQVSEAGERHKAIRDESAPLLARGHFQPDTTMPAAVSPLHLEEPADRLATALARADAALQRLKGLWSLRLIGVRGFLCWLALFGFLLPIPSVLFPETRFYWFAGGEGFAFLAAGAAHLLMRSRAFRRTQEIGAELTS